MDRLGVGQALVDTRHHLEDRQGVLRHAAGLRVRPAARGRASAARLHQPAAVLLRALLHRGRPRERPDRHPLAGGGDRHRADGRRRAARHRHARRLLPHHGRLGDRRRRRPLHAAPAAGPRLRGPRVPGPVPDLRHQDADAAAGRALVLVRPALQSRPVGPAAPAGRRRVAARLPGRQRGRPRRGDQARERRQARARHARRGHRVHASSGSASTGSSRGGWRNSATAASSSPATPRTRCRRSARAAATAACRTPTTSPGSSTWCCAAWRPSACSTATRPSACRPPTRTCAITTRSTDFISPKGAMSRTFRDGVLALAETEPFARRLVNSGRLSVATCYAGSPLNGPDEFAPANARRCAPAPPRSTPRSATAGCWITWMAASRPFCSAATGSSPMLSGSVQAEPCRPRSAGQIRHCFTGNSLCPLRRRARSRALPVPPRSARRGALAGICAGGHRGGARSGHGPILT